MELIDRVRCPSFIVHSIEDEIIPIQHARLLFEKYSEKHGKDRIWFLEINRLKHNSLHKFFGKQLGNLVSKSDNDLKVELREFLHELRKHKLSEQPDSEKRTALRSRLREAELDEAEDFDEGQYELMAVTESKEIVMPGKHFSQQRRLLPRCFD